MTDRTGDVRWWGSCVQIIAPALEGRDPTQQAELDELMTATLDGTANLSQLGANAIMAASAAVCKAGAAEAGLPLYRHVGALAGNARMVLPVPQFNALSGGLHSGAANGLPVQEFLLFPSGAVSFAEAMRMGTETYHHLKRIIGVRYQRGSIVILLCRRGRLGGDEKHFNQVSEFPT